METEIQASRSLGVGSFGPYQNLGRHRLARTTRVMVGLISAGGPVIQTGSNVYRGVVCRVSEDDSFCRWLGVRRPYLCGLRVCLRSPGGEERSSNDVVMLFDLFSALCFPLEIQTRRWFLPSRFRGVTHPTFIKSLQKTRSW
jgi:hypothetical protein